MKHTPCHCVFPSAAEEELITIPGEEPNTALRVFVDAAREGYVRLQQLAYTDGIGWYVQKSMVIPRDVLTLLVPQLRKAMCLMPPRGSRREAAGDPIAFPRLASSEPLDALEPTGS